ncbi:hypothetical protein FRC09_002204 [Ceratobasidium sp. 395]|nr:hypothetical protein FRC09_002204 [Ceratobasidium sp. 395]
MSVECFDPMIVPSTGPEVAVPWFQTAPIPAEMLDRITGIQLSTLSHDQGWVTDPAAGAWTWYQIQVLIDETSNARGKARSASSTMWTSHRNAMASSMAEIQEGHFFDPSHEMFSVLHAGDRLEVTAHARFRGWTNYAERGCLQVFVRWEPSPEMMKIVYDGVSSAK